jgi:hypothetical protein
MAVTQLVKKALENFANGEKKVAPGAAKTPNNDKEEQPSNSQLFILTVMIMLWFLLVILVGKYLWNECLCKVLTICKPTNDLFVIFGIILLFDILHPKF